MTGTWKELRKQVAEALNFCASGQPYWSVDIGGFFMTQWNTWFERCSIYDEWYDLGIVSCIPAGSNLPASCP